MASQLGEFLTGLHDYPVERAREAGVPMKRDLVRIWRERCREQLSRIGTLSVDPGRIGRFLDDHLPPHFEGTPCLVHNDLWAEHILVDCRSGEAVAIIDWGDAAISDPAVDFAPLQAWYGEDWLVKVLGCYSGARDGGLILRTRYLAACLAVHNIVLGREHGISQWVKCGERALRLLFAD